MKNHRTILAGLATEQYHHCCDEAEMILFPPHRATEGPIQIEVGTLEISEISHWYIDLGDGGPDIKVFFCPWCGQELLTSGLVSW